MNLRLPSSSSLLQQQSIRPRILHLTESYTILLESGHIGSVHAQMPWTKIHFGNLSCDVSDVIIVLRLTYKDFYGQTRSKDNGIKPEVGGSRDAAIDWDEEEIKFKVVCLHLYSNSSLTCPQLLITHHHTSCYYYCCCCLFHCSYGSFAFLALSFQCL